MRKLWEDWQGVVYFAAAVAFCYFVGIAQVIPVWLGFIILMSPTVLFVGSVIFALELGTGPFTRTDGWILRLIAWITKERRA